MTTTTIRRVVRRHANPERHRQELADGINGVVAQLGRQTVASSALSWAEAPIVGASLGSLIAVTSTGLRLATNAVAGRRAYAVVHEAVPTRQVLLAAPGRLRWPSHGQGTAGQVLWLDTGGGYTTTKPSGAVRVIQQVAIVVDADHLWVNLYYPELDR